LESHPSYPEIVSISQKTKYYIVVCCTFALLSAFFFTFTEMDLFLDNIYLYVIVFSLLETIIFFYFKLIVLGELSLIYPLINVWDFFTFFSIFKVNKFSTLISVTLTRQLIILLIKIVLEPFLYEIISIKQL
jgi:hypothetical protein